MTRSSSVLLSVLATTLAVAGCDLPTEAPILEQRWLVPVESSTIGVADLLPDGVTDEGDAFAVEVDPFARTVTLGEMCTQCVDSQGVPVPKRAFQHAFTVTQDLPADVQAVAVETGAIEIAIDNDLGFDPIRPGGEPGTVTVTLRDGEGGPAVATLVLDGASDALPSGSQVVRTLSLDGADLGATLAVDVEIDSPAGDPTPIDPSRELVATATPTALLVASATVEVAGREVSVDPVELDVEDIDGDITDRIQSGDIVLEVANPFGVSVSGQLTLERPDVRLSKPLTIPAASASTVRLGYTGDDLRTFLGRADVRLTGSATVDGGAGTITVTPGQELTLEADLDLIIRIGD